MIPHRLYFARLSGSWGGGVAFIDATSAFSGQCAPPTALRDSGWTVGRAWRISRSQFEDILAQENGRSPGEVKLDWPDLIQAGRFDLGSGWYRMVVGLATLDSVPAFTFTDIGPSSAAARPPSEAYLKTMAEGLGQCLPDWSGQRIRTYLDLRVQGRIDQ